VVRCGIWAYNGYGDDNKIRGVKSRFSREDQGGKEKVVVVKELLRNLNIYMKIEK
jgi:hypothetical protein